MKSKYLFCLIILSALFTGSVKAEENNPYVFVKEEERQTTATGIYVTSNIYIDSFTNSFDIVTSKGTIEINDQYNKHILADDYLYICSNSKIYLVNLNLLSFNVYDISLDIEDFVVNEYIYIVGSFNNNPKIIILSKEAKLLKEKVFSSKDYGKFTHIESNSDELFVTLEKDSFFESDDFLKVGSIGQIKSVLIKFTKSLEIENTYYFNEYKENERITSLLVGDSVKALINTNGEYYIYEFNENLELVKRKKLGDLGNAYLVKNIDNLDLILINNGNSFLINLYDNDEVINVFSKNKKLKFYDVINEGIIFSFDKGFEIYSEYHIKKIDTLELDKLNYNINSTDHIEVLSFFEKLEFHLETTSPFHQHMMSGEYIGTYVSQNAYGTNIYINAPIRVKNYVNVIDGGVYKLNTKLFFFGKAALNNTYINNGYSLNEEGTYELVIEDVNSNKHIYNIKVIDEYYKDNDHYVMDVDFVLNKNKQLEIEVFLQDASNIDSLIIDNEEIKTFDINDNKISFKDKCTDGWGYFTKTINGIKINEEIIQINKTFTYLVLKDMPVVSIKTSRLEEDYIIDISHIDNDNAFVDIYFDYIDKVFYYTYELGDGVLHKVKIASVDKEDVDYEIISNDKNTSIKIKNDSIRSLRVNDKEIYVYDNNQINKILIIICISSTVFITIFLVTTIILKQIKSRNANRI